MDDLQFDRVARAVAGLTSRRSLLGIAASLPLVDGVLAEDASARRRKTRDRKDRNRKDDRDEVQGEKKKKKVTLCLNGQTIRVSKKKKKKFLNQGATPGACKACIPDAKTTTCAGKCGDVTNNCNQVVDCGSCACDPPCGECTTCNEATGVCETKPADTPCGEGPRCSNGLERYQDTCDGNGTCVEGGGEFCGFYLCAGTVCGDTCASNTDCDPNAFCSGSGECLPYGNYGDSCQADNECFSGQCCNNVCRQCCDSDVCTESTAPVCVNNVCSACTADPGNCPTGTCCNSTTLQCVATCPQDEVCRESNTCGAPCTNGSCQVDEICVEGVCRECTLFNGQNLQTAITNANSGATLYLCPGTYNEPTTEFGIDKSITLIGAGDGAGGTVVGDRILVTAAADQPVTFRNLAITGQGIGVHLIGGNLTMRGCTVRESGRGIWKEGGSLAMHNCNVIDNTAVGDGGGIRNTNGSLELHNCLIAGNSAGSGGGIFTNHLTAETSSLTLNNTVVRDNTATGGIGAGVYNFQSRSVVSISADSVICANTPLANQCEEINQSQCEDVCPS